MTAASHCRRLGDELYRTAFPLYRLLYGGFKSYTDRAERALLRRHLTPGSIVADAGANIGIYSQFLSKCIGPDGIVHSFEPSPDNFRRLHERLKSFDNVRLNQLAVSNETGESILYVSDELNVDHRAYPAEGDMRRTIAIRSTALDDYFKPGERVDLIKMDIQGYELHALLGARRVLEENPQVKLLLEFWPHGLKQAGMSGEALISFLTERGFTLFLPEGRGLPKWDCPREYPSDAKNYLNLFAQKAIRE